MFQIRTDRGEWWEQAVCAADQFVRLEDGSYLCTTIGSPIWFRCVEKHTNHFVNVNGGGRRFEYRLLKIEPDGRIELPEGGALYPRGHPKFPAER